MEKSNVIDVKVRVALCAQNVVAPEKVSLLYNHEQIDERQTNLLKFLFYHYCILTKNAVVIDLVNMEIKNGDLE